jgi:tetratricopeptide (TPR) repeat protein
MRHTICTKKGFLWGLVLSLTTVSFVVPAAQSEPLGTTRAQEALALARHAAISRRHGHLVKSCELFTRAMRLTPTWAVAQLEVGRCLRLLGDPERKALGHLRKALKWYPQWSLVHVEVGRLAEDRGQHKDAIRAYRRASRLTPVDIRAVDGLARYARRDGGLPALVRVRRLVHRMPHSVAAWRKLADIAEAQKAYTEAEKAWMEIVKRSQYTKRAAAGMARFALRAGRHKALLKAKKLLQKR